MKTKYKGFLKEDEKTFTNVAQVNGYHFGDRLLEGVMFRIFVEEDGSLRAETTTDAKEYMKDLNEKKWLAIAVGFAEDNDIFYGDDNGKTTSEELILVKKD